jgi:hypothetical protein
VRRVCTKCKVEKDISEFHRWSQGPDGYHYHCKSCKASYRKRYDAQPRVTMSSREYQLIRKYGVTLDAYNEMFESQGGVCAVCARPETRLNRSGDIAPLAVDHNHNTGEVRGLLCRDCNIAIGHANEDITRLTKMIQYLVEGGI